MRSILRRCANPPRTSTNSSDSDGTDTGGASPPAQTARAPTSTFGRGTNTVGGTAPDQRGLGVVRDLHRDRSVLRVAGPCGQSLPHLSLHHHQDPSDGRRLLEQPHHDGYGDVVGQVRHARPRSPSTSTAAQSTDAASATRTSTVPRSTPPDRAPTRGRVRAWRRARPRAPRAPRSRSASVSEPRPGPISRTASPGCTAGDGRRPAARCSDRRGSAARGSSSDGSRAPSAAPDRRRREHLHGAHKLPGHLIMRRSLRAGHPPRGRSLLAHASLTASRLVPLSLPMQHVARAAPGGPAVGGEDPLPHDDLLLAGGLARDRREARARRTRPTCCRAIPSPPSYPPGEPSMVLQRPPDSQAANVSQCQSAFVPYPMICDTGSLDRTLERTVVATTTPFSTRSR